MEKQVVLLRKGEVIRRKILSILLALGMIFTASPAAAHVADSDNVISAAESKKAIKDSMSGVGSEKDGWQAKEESSLRKVGLENSLKNLANYNDTASIESMDEFAPVYRDFLTRRIDYFSIVLPLETTEESVKDYKPISIAVNDNEPDSWTNGSNISYSSLSGEPDCSGPDDETQSITFKMSTTHTYGYEGDNSEYFFVGLQNAVPEDVIVYATAVVDSGSNAGLVGAENAIAEFNDDRTALRFHASCPLGSLNQTFVSIRLDFEGLQITNDKKEKTDELIHAVNKIYWDEALDYNGKPYEGDYLRVQMSPNFWVETDRVSKEGSHVTYNARIRFSQSVTAIS